MATETNLNEICVEWIDEMVTDGWMPGVIIEDGLIVGTERETFPSCE